MQQRFRMKPIYLLVLQALAGSVCAAAPDAPEAAAMAVSADVAAAAVGPMLVVEILGAGQSRQVQNITRSDLVKLVPGTSPLKGLEKLPGVNFESADPFGAYEWSTRFSVRGFGQTQMGFTLDGIPLGDMSYGNNNGLHISRAISSENVGRVAISQGAGALATASTSNLGGTVQFTTLDPSDTMGATLAQTLGGSGTARTFVRFDSGLLGSGTKLFVSGTRQRADKWKGDGGQNQDQINSKFVQTLGEHTLSGFFNSSDRSEVDYQDLSLEGVKRLGFNWDNYAPDFKRAVDAANGIFTGGVTNVDDAYYQASGLRKDNLGGLALDLKLDAAASLKTSVYHHDNKGQGHWYIPGVNSSPTLPIAVRTTEYKIDRNGILSDLNWELDNHSVSAGVWAERSNHMATRNFYAIKGNEDTNFFLSGPLKTDWQQKFVTTTTQFYVNDEIALMDKQLRLNVGFKSPKVKIEATSVTGTRAFGEITAKKSFLPQVGLNFSLNRNDELFASASQSMRAFQPGVNGPFSQKETAFIVSAADLKPETAITLDFGMRFKRDALQGSVAFYHSDFSDRQLQLATCPGITGCPSVFVNVGKVKTQGLEAIGVYKFDKELSLFNSFTFNDSTYQSNYRDNNYVSDASLPETDARKHSVPAAGKQVVDAPRVMFNTELSYENSVWFTRVGAKYTARRYYSYTNDAGVPAFWIGTLSAGYKLPSMGVFKDLSLQLNISNLFDKQYFSTVGTNGFVTSDPKGQYTTLLNGAPRQAFLTLSGKL
jgi:iron complex outermembrane receptor protein